MLAFVGDGIRFQEAGLHGMEDAYEDAYEVLAKGAMEYSHMPYRRPAVNSEIRN